MAKVEVEVSLTGTEELLRTWLIRERATYRSIRREARKGLNVQQDIEGFKLAISDIQKVASGHPLLKSIKDEADELENKFAEDVDIPVYV